MPTSKKQNTMAQIFTSKGKGANVERKPIGFDALTANPIGIAKQAQNYQSLSCVGFAIPKVPRQPQETCQRGAMSDYDRVPDPDFDPAIWADSLTTSETD